MSVVQEKITGASTRVRITAPKGVSLPVDFKNPKGEKRVYTKGSQINMPRAHALQLVNHKLAVEALVTVRLTSAYRSHNSGEECGFSPDEANYIFKQKLGKPVYEDVSILEEHRDVGTELNEKTSIRAMKWQEAVALIASETDEDRLAVYAAEDQRTSVQTAIRERLEELLGPVDDDDDDLDDEDEDE